MTKKEVRRFLNTHRDVELSAAKFEYSLHLCRNVENVMFKLAERVNKRDDVDKKTIEEMIKKASSPDEIIKLMRKEMVTGERVKVINKAIDIEEEILPLIKSRVLSTGQHMFIENALKFFLRCKTNCSQWIMENYQEIRSEYMKSMLCLVLGFRGDASMIDFLIEEAERFERDYPDENYDQAPFLAVQELSVRFLN